MKILFFIDSLIAGGKERRLSELIKGLKSSDDFDIDLVVMNDKIHYKEILNQDITVHFLLRKSKKDVSVFKEFYKICKNRRPDIVHCWDSMTAVYSVPACRFLNIILVNGMVVDTPVKRNYLNKHWRRAKFTFPFSDIVIGNSNAGLKAYGAPAHKSVCIYNGMNLSRFKNLRSAESIKKELFGEDTFDFVAGMVAAFEERKDYKTLVEAAIRILETKDSIRFVFVGNGTNFKKIKETVPDLFNKQIIFTGTRPDVEAIVNIFNVGVLLTNSKVHGEGISNSIIEYMALSKPVIATRGGGTDEVVFDNINGYLINPGSENEFLQKLQFLINNPQKAQEMGEKACQMVTEKFDIKVMTENYKKVYQNLMKQKQN